MKFSRVVLGAHHKDLALDPCVKDYLFPHQIKGVNWLHRTLSPADAPFRGGVLADEMGLGKTIQCAAYIGAAMRQGIHPSVLFVVPVSLMDIWVKAIAQWGMVPKNRINVMKASSSKARACLTPTPGVVTITSYGVISSDVTKWNLSNPFGLVVLDEGHLIKDAATQAHQACIRIPSKKRLLMTGTPVMNDLVELYTLFQFIDPTVFGKCASEFRRINEEVIDGMLQNSTATARARSKQHLDYIKAAVSPVFLQRTKMRELSVAIMPSKKRERVVWVPMSPHQLALYRAVLRHPLLRRLTDENGVRTKTSGMVLCWLTALKKICDHTWLHMKNEEFNALLASNLTLPIAAHYGDVTEGSSKVASVLLILKDHLAKRKEKVLIFSRSMWLLKIVEIAIVQMEEDLGVPRDLIMHINGSVAPPNRQALVDRFNTGPCKVCLLTTQVGGLGLTLTGANCVVLMDPSWNPAVDAQAVDRAHRIGQRRDVTVYRLITCGTVEEAIYRRQVFKTKIMNEGHTSQFTRGELRAMLRLGVTHRSETHERLISCFGDGLVAVGHALGSHAEVTDHTQAMLCHVTHAPCRRAIPPSTPLPATSIHFGPQPIQPPHVHVPMKLDLELEKHLLKPKKEKQNNAEVGEEWVAPPMEYHAYEAPQHTNNGWRRSVKSVKEDISHLATSLMSRVYSLFGMKRAASAS